MTLSLSKLPPALRKKKHPQLFQREMNPGTKLKMEDWPHLDGGGTVAWESRK